MSGLRAVGLQSDAFGNGAQDLISAMIFLEISERAGGDRPATPVLRPRPSLRDERALEGSQTNRTQDLTHTSHDAGGHAGLNGHRSTSVRGYDGSTSVALPPPTRTLTESDRLNTSP